VFVHTFKQQLQMNDTKTSSNIWQQPGIVNTIGDGNGKGCLNVCILFFPELLC
jgi:hypothetical protein